MSSIQKCFERYKILYVWKILSNLVPNCGIIQAPHSDMRGRYALIPRVHGQAAEYKNLKECSFCIEGPKLFNSMPQFIRDFNGSKESFKHISTYFYRKFMINQVEHLD